LYALICQETPQWWTLDRGRAEKTSRHYSEMYQLFNIDATATPHQSLNSSKDVIKCSDLAGMIDTDIADKLKSQQVSNIKRIHSTRDGNRVPTNTLIVTFSTTLLPSSIRVGYLNVRVAVYIPF
jgi:hypothetical protein